MANYDEPLTFRHGATVKNRFVQPPMLTSNGKDGYATQETIDYYNAHSKSGGMIITEYMYVSENGGPALTWKRGREQLAVYDDKFIPQLTKVATAIKHSGNKAIMQIAHTGREANYRAIQGKPVYAPSALDLSFLPYKIHELSDEQIKDIISDFGKATKRSIDAGFDGVEIHGANHYLIQQFVSAFSNRRDDHWGGSLEKRFNFPLAVVESVMNTVKKYAPKDFIVGYRISPEEIHGTNIGYTWHESTKLIDAITKQFELDYIHLSMPHYDAKPGDAMLLDRDIADSKYKDSNKPFATLFKPYLNGAKEIIVGGINSKAKAESAIALADLIAVGRENIIDPLFAEKLMHNDEKDIVTELSIEQVNKNHMTQGLIDNYSSENTGISIPGEENIRSLHNGFGGWSEIHYPKNSETKE
ncbi:NADH-dependent oxidoreductase [Lactobacillus sp. 3B(2020)]|uniref:oxidoreductase n=1 Tax=Lactobacillus sp. 3B(2020) TaxID=2695882 RepID=UPI0015DD887D|nr:NADH-dependent oxidoreductase [Lactobacillus sp. 3B(2020)]QLL70572.1 NADH-dependent oxidoreductase [Lactobacillus sp. 3B(2020)]